jgi:dephospho-CoA kinase
MKLRIGDTKDNPLLLGVTGGIASGKSTVAQFLKDLGASVIDFDVIAREIVEPGKAALREIVDYFGEKVLDKEGSLDRKRLSEIVFQDREKRKKLEGMTHPRIVDAFIKEANHLAKEEPDAIIQAVIPLLFEVSLQHLFHKTLVVYIPREKQIERLTKRDRISTELASSIINAQLPIDEKISMADFVINNEDSVEETRVQVNELWQILKKLQENSKNL